MGAHLAADLTCAIIRKHLLGYIQGSEYLCMYFRALGCTIGANVALYPCGSDPMMASPRIEPSLATAVAALD